MHPVSVRKGRHAVSYVPELWGPLHKRAFYSASSYIPDWLLSFTSTDWFATRFCKIKTKFPNCFFTGLWRFQFSINWFLKYCFSSYIRQFYQLGIENASPFSCFKCAVCRSKWYSRSYWSLIVVLGGFRHQRFSLDLPINMMLINSWSVWYQAWLLNLDIP